MRRRPVGEPNAGEMNLSLESDARRKQTTSPQQPQQQHQHGHQRQRSVEIITISRQVQQVPHGSQQSVIREQYCSCAPQTRTEQIMLVVIIAMSFCIVGLVAALGAVAKTSCDPQGLHNQNSLF